MSNQNESIASVWKSAGKLIAVALPRWIIARFNARHDGHGFAVKAIPFVIVFLSLASVTNLAGRAYLHHEGISAYLTGTGIAVLVPLAVLAAMLIDGKWRFLFWAMALAFAAISGTIQYNIYYVDGTWLSIAEAMAFGYGVPVSEVMLAIMEARLIVQLDNQKAMAIQSAAESEAMDRKQQIADEEADELREFERQKRKIQLDAMRTKAQLDAKIEEQKAMVTIRIKEQKAMATQPATKPATKPATSQSEKPAKLNMRDIQLRMIPIYQSNPTISDANMAAEIGKSKKTIQDALADLVAKEVVEVEKVGRGKSVSVNGKYPQFANEG